MRAHFLAGLLALGGAAGAAAAAPLYGVPVRCFHSAALAPGLGTFLLCVAADGTAFTDTQRVPDGRWLLVTDVLLTPQAGTISAGVSQVTVYDSYGSNSRQSSFDLRGVNTATRSLHFHAPYLSLAAGHRLEVVASAVSSDALMVRVTGLLTAAPRVGIVGDVNGDGLLSIADVIYLINHLFRGGPPPVE